MFSDRKALSPKLYLHRTGEGVIGLYPEYPILDQLIDVIPSIREADNPPRPNGWRGLIDLDLPTSEGVLPIIVKPRHTRRGFELNRERYMRVLESRWRMQAIPKNSSLYDEYKKHVDLYRESIKGDSVVREITIARFSAVEYEARYSTPLQIEQAIGFFKDTDGRGWSFFERITDEIDVGLLAKEKQLEIEDKGSRFVDLMIQRLLSIGVDPVDLFEKRTKNVMTCGDPSNPGFVLIDTEDWERRILSKGK